MKHMSEIKSYDAIVIGSGEAGKFMAWHLASSGKRAVVVERKYLGGSCPNIACLPSKSVIHGAKVAWYFRHREEFGLNTGAWQVEMPAVHARKERMIDGLRAMHLEKYKQSGAELLYGSARFTGKKTLEVALHDGGTVALQAEMIFLNTGTRATVEPITGLQDAAALTHVEALELEVVPEHLIILGGGYVGLEFAQAMRRFGNRVTVLERGERLLPREDADVSEAVSRLFEEEGISVIPNARVTHVHGRSGEHVQVTVIQGKTEFVLDGSHLLVATGRTPNTDELGLEAAGIETTERGFIKVNERLETTSPGVWAMGDCAGSPLFTHISYEDFRIIRDNLDGGNRVTTGRQVPSCLFIDPELARIGLNETEAKRQGVTYRLAKIPMVAVLRTRTLSETKGFLKALVGADDQVLGFTGFGVSAGELMPAIQLAMKHGLPYTALRDLTITHPTIAEGIVGLFSAVPKKTI
jgi:pyruvate/2-oxoglutarate dehydrogenase complex dihydrolipoamide dehydrogenase (E3) component